MKKGRIMPKVKCNCVPSSGFHQHHCSVSQRMRAELIELGKPPERPDPTKRARVEDTPMEMSTQAAWRLLGDDMDADEVVEFLDWLEAVFPTRLEFRDKRALADGFVEQRSHRIYDEYKHEHN